MVLRGLVLALVCSLSSTAMASNWSRASDPRTLRQLVIDISMRMAVVGMGEGAAPEEIATAVGAGLAETPGIDFVVKTCPGLEPHHSDLQAVSRCHRAGANYILVVRVFPGPPMGAVLSVYDRNGESVAAVSVAAGALSSRDRPEAEKSDEGVSEDAIRSVQALQRWNKERLWIDEDATDESSLSDGVLRQGDKGLIVYPSEFYTLLDEKQMLKSFTWKIKTKIGLGAGLGLMGLMASVMALGGIVDPVGTCGGPCEDGERLRLIGEPLSVVAISGGGLWLLTMWDANPIEMPTVRERVKEYNRNLRRKMGMPPLKSNVMEHDEPGRSLALRPYLTAGGGGLSLGFQW